MYCMDRSQVMASHRVQKQPISPARVRHLPPQFSWIDQRLVRHHYLEQCDHTTLALYLFLVTVADAQGLSFYSDRGVCQRLDLEAADLTRARDWLVHLHLIAWQAPLYQVLALEGEDD
jgi:hypothetical protein